MGAIADISKKSVKRDANRVGSGLILYTIVMYVVAIIYMTVATVHIILTYPNDPIQQMMLDKFVASLEESGTYMLCGVVIGVLFLCFFFRKTISVRDLFESKKKMTAQAFFKLLCVFMGGQLLFSIGSHLLEMGLNVLGYSALQSIENASGVSTTMSMFLYASIVGPIVEEITFRGFVLRTFRKYGKMTAIMVSAVLFGVMHANLPQGVFAFGVGIVLGYVAVEYSIGWAIALHIINNCLFGDLLGIAIAGLSESTQNIILNGVLIIFAILAVCILWRKRKSMKFFCQHNKGIRKLYGYIYTSIGILIYIVAEVVVAICMLEPL